jgi:thiol-disulfide isomerase/thioredoxin
MVDGEKLHNGSDQLCRKCGVENESVSRPEPTGLSRRRALSVIAGCTAATLVAMTTAASAKAADNFLPTLEPRAPSPHAAPARNFHSSLRDEGPMPDLNGAISWINSAPLTRESLRGKVVLVDFWTYTCINSIRPLPYAKAWAERYKNAGLTIIGVHTPEFSFEHEPANVKWAVRNFNLTYPIAIDSNSKIWQAFNNEYWPAQYLVDAKGRIRYHHFGEGDYGEIERHIQELLKENGATGIEDSVLQVTASGIEAPPDFANSKSPESYLGYRQAQNFSSGHVAKNSAKSYESPAKLSLNHWGLSGSWNVEAESVVLQATPGKVVFRFHSRDLHLILAPSAEAKPARFRVQLDGAAPGENRGVDIASDGTGEIREPRLYQLIRQKGSIVDRTLEIEFIDSGAHALDFTFG